MCGKCKRIGNNCNCNEVTRNIKLSNNSIGRDGETYYQFMVRMGFQGTEEELSNQTINNTYTEDNW